MRWTRLSNGFTIPRVRCISMEMHRWPHREPPPGRDGALLGRRRHTGTRLILCPLCLPAPPRSFIPDEHMVWCPEQLLQCVLAHIHYMPDHWRGHANKGETRDEVAQLFQYKAVSAEEGWTLWGRNQCAIIIDQYCDLVRDFSF